MSTIKRILEEVRLNHLTFHLRYGDYDPYCKFCVEARENDIKETVLSDPNHFDGDAGEEKEVEEYV